MLKLLSKVRQKLLPTAAERRGNKWHREVGDGVLLEFDIGPSDTVLEIGGFEGNWASDMFDRYGCSVITAEPVHEYAETMRQRFAGNPKITVVEAAVGATSRDQEIYIAGAGSTTALKRGKNVTIKVVDIVELVASLGVDQFSVMICNCEGGEYELFPRLIDTGLAERFDTLLIQFHPTMPGYKAAREAIREGLRSTHTETMCHPYVWERWDRGSKLPASKQP